jgi:hypothetical protein
MYKQNVQLWRFARTAELSVIEIGSADDWQDHPDCPHRVVFGQDRVVQCRDGGEVTVSTSCIQFSDGSIGRSLSTASREAKSVYEGGPGAGTFSSAVDSGAVGQA